MTAQTDGRGLVGRDDELRLVERALREAAGGGPHVLLVTGEAGIGKTALVTAASGLAERLGYLVVWGRCWEGDAPPGWLWSQVLRGLGRVTDRDAPPAAEQLWPAVAESLSQLAQDRPVVVVLEDLHDADLADLIALPRILARVQDARVLILATFRDAAQRRSDDLGSALSALAATHRRIALTGLGLDAVALLVGENGAEADRARAQQIWAAAAGNPLLVSLLARTSSGLDDPNDPDREPPEELRVHVRRQVERLPPATRALLPLLTVQPRTAALEEVAAARGIPPHEVRAALEPALAEGILEESGGALRFRHHVVRASLYADLAPAERARLHGDAARAMARLGLQGPVARARRVHHAYHASLGEDDPAQQLADLRSAAAMARDAGAHEEAVRLLDHAVDAAENAGAHPRERGRVLLDLADVQDATGRHTQAEHSRHAAAALGRLSGDAHLLARAAVAVARGSLFLDLANPANVHELEEALEALPETPSPLRAKVLGHLAPALYWTRERGRAVELAQQAEATARACGDAQALAVALLARHHVTRGRENAAARIALADDAAHAADVTHDDELSVLARSVRVADHREIGDRDGVAHAISALRLFASARRNAAGRWAAEVHELVSALLAGDAHEVTRQERALSSLGQAARDHGYLVDFARSMTELGPLTDAARTRMEARSRRLPHVLPWRARLLLDQAEHGEEQAADELQELLGLLRGSAVAGTHWLLSAVLTSEAAVLLKDVRSAAELRALLEPHAEAFVVAGRVAACRGHVRHHLGALALITGDSAAAVAELEVAERLHDSAGATQYGDCSRELLRRARRNLPSAQGEGDLGLLERRGAYWVVSRPEGDLTLPDLKGMRYLAALVGSQHEPVAALSLVRLESAGRPDVEPLQDGLELDAGGADALLDARAKRAYRQRLAEIGVEMAMARHDPDRLRRLEHERDAVRSALATGTGLGGRDRRMPSDAERARTSVTKALRAAVERIREVDAVLAAHLDDSLRTGAQCVYAPSGPALGLGRR